MNVRNRNIAALLLCLLGAACNDRSDQIKSSGGDGSDTFVFKPNAIPSCSPSKDGPQCKAIQPTQPSQQAKRN